MRIRHAVKAILPTPWVRSVQQYRARKFTEDCSTLTVQQAFAKIYEEGAWGRSDDPSQPFFSGSGSHDGRVIDAYVDAIQGFLSTFETKPDVVDLGCGDFFVGSKLRRFCGRYTACDIVPELVAFDRQRYKDLDVDFRVVDLTTDELPAGDVVFIRQVLQHLSNAQILQALPAICAKYKYLVLTEHLPGTPAFAHNLDKRVGPEIRTGSGSGIVLTSPPFNLKAESERALCNVAEYGGIIRTTLYTLS